MTVYILQHAYDYTYGENSEFEDTEVKLLGVYSSEEKAKEAVERYFLLPGFNKYSKDCFEIDKYTLDEDSSWTDGFISSAEAREELIEQLRDEEEESK